MKTGENESIWKIDIIKRFLKVNKGQIRLLLTLTFADFVVKWESRKGAWKVRISDEITAYILHMLEQADDGEAELQRNVLAEELGCVPSQISYVLTSRFTPEQGYIVESRRGGGGYIRIHRIKYRNEMPPLMHTVNAIGDALSDRTARAILQNLVDGGYLSPENARVMAAGVSEQAYREIPADRRDRLRAAAMKLMLTALIV